jgi:hypothetical protein
MVMIFIRKDAFVGSYCGTSKALEKTVEKHINEGMARSK